MKNPITAGRHFAAIGTLIPGVVVAVVAFLPSLPNEAIAAVGENAIIQAGVGFVIIAIIAGLHTPPKNPIATAGL